MVVAVVGVLVAAIVTTVVLVTQGGSRTTRPAADPGTQQPPVPISTSATTTEPTTGRRTTTQESTTRESTTRESTTEGTTTEETAPEETTTAPRATDRTTEPRTTPRTTSAPGDEVFVRDQKDATAVAGAWADAVNSGDAPAVRELSCAQDLEAFSSGESGESGDPAGLAGQVSLTLKSVITARPHGLAEFTATPALSGRSTVQSFLTRQDGRWRICVTVTRAEDL